MLTHLHCRDGRTFSYDKIRRETGKKSESFLPSDWCFMMVSMLFSKRLRKQTIMRLQGQKLRDYGKRASKEIV